MSAIDLVALGLVGLLLLTMPVFAVIGRDRPMDADVARRSRTILLGRWVRDWLMWVIGPIESAMVRARVNPDVLNFIGALMGLAAGIAFALGAMGAAGWLILLGGVADIFDGRIARARGIASAYGAFIDSSLDRFAETFTFLGLIVYYSRWPFIALACAAALGGSMLVSYTRARGEALGVSNTAGVMQRAERLVLLALGAILDPLITVRAGWQSGVLLAGTIVVIAVGAFGTGVYRTAAIASALKAKDRR